METLAAVGLLVVLVLVAAMVLFARQMHVLVEALRHQVELDLVASERLEATVDRMEDATKVVACNLRDTSAALASAARQRALVVETLDRMEEATHVVADNLADSVGRADAADSNIPGKSADAAHRTAE